MTTQSKELALDDRQYELLLEGCRRIPKERQAREARFACLVAGRLGLRAGEIVHMREEWVDWRSRRIQIPTQQTCRKGRNGKTCGRSQKQD